MQFEPSPHFTKGQSGVDFCQFFQKGGGVVPKKGQGFKSQKPWYTFFRTRNNMFACTIVHLTFRAPQTVVRARLYANVYLAVHLPQRQKYFTVEGKLKVFSTLHQPRIYSGYLDFFYRERNNRRVSCLPRTNNQTTFCQLCLKTINMLSPSQCLLV